MRQLFAGFFLVLCSFQVIAQPMPEITCKSVGVASCSTDQGYCFEFFQTPSSDPEYWENMCQSMQGTFTETRCDASYSALTCLNKNNLMMPIIRFSTEMEPQMAQMMCGAMGGTICPQ